MDEKNLVPYIAHEGMMARMERSIKRITILAALAILLLFISNAAWLYAWTRYDYGAEETTTVSQDISQDGEGVNIVGDDNDGTNSTDEGN